MPEPLIDPFGRNINYVRMSVTDRCDFRCVYCMDEVMTFLPKEAVLSLEEIYFVAQAFTEMGVNKIRLTGGEPLVRRGVDDLLVQMGALPGLADFCLTTNGSQLERFAATLYQAGMTRLNISLDTLNPLLFKELTRTGKLEQVLRGIDTACRHPFKHMKLNAVILKGRNDHEIIPLLEFAIARGIDISFIEEMPLGHINEHDRAATFCSSDDVRGIIEQTYQLTPSDYITGGPSKYWQVAGSATRVGFISPHSHNFCGECNRVRVTVEGQLLLCLGNENSVDLKAELRERPGDIEHLKRVIRQAITRKPEKHHFTTDGAVDIVRFMNTTGG